MLNVKQILSERTKEINFYVAYLPTIEDVVDETLFKVMKANTLLMLYNLIEAVISNSIDAIRDSIYKNTEIEFDSLKEEIKIQIIKDLKKNISPENLVKRTQKISNDIIKLSFDRKKISDGNIDLPKISELAKIYGFEIKGSIYSETNHGDTITIIKDKRNDLAHGTYSFSEIGKIYSFEDIQKMSNQTIKYLEYITNNIEIYIQNQHYKTAN